jgi:ABC-2 type transport system permease protein
MAKLGDIPAADQFNGLRHDSRFRVRPTSRSPPRRTRRRSRQVYKVSGVTDQVRGGRRTARFVSESPIMNLLVDPVRPLCGL